MPCVLLSLLFLSSCARLPKNPEKQESFAKEMQQDLFLPRHKLELLKHAEEGESAFLLVPENVEALKWRLALIDQAEHSIDFQVFIWTDDEAGRLVFERLLAAAQRGVRVRVLLDDMPKGWSDQVTALVDRQEGINVRRFNPAKARKGAISKALHYSKKFRELNRRMHNKQILVDGSWAILGGRNIGNPYFGLSKKYNNLDLDMLVCGPVLRDLSEDFDEYWNSDAAYPGYAMHKEFSEAKLEQSWQSFLAQRAEDNQLLEAAGIPTEYQSWEDEFDTLPERVHYGTTETFQDSPQVKGNERGERLIYQLEGAGVVSQGEALIISPYLIPSKAMLARMGQLALEEGRVIRILVPSLQSNNHTVVHSHYRKYRRRMLQNGVKLYELKGQPSSETRALSDSPAQPSKFTSLHAKLFILDRRWVLLGSLNLDPRSIEINTENMVVIDSPSLAEETTALFESYISPENAWQLQLDAEDYFFWEDDSGKRYIEPSRGLLQKLSAVFFRFLPIEGQL